MAKIKGMSHKTVTAEFSQEEWTVLLDALKTGTWRADLQTAREALVKSITPTPAVNRSRFNKGPT